jgi:hypothetical protein
MEHPCTGSIPSRLASHLRLHYLRERLQTLRTQLAEQIDDLPSGNERWLDTERELNAAESAFAQFSASH